MKIKTNTCDWFDDNGLYMDNDKLIEALGALTELYPEDEEVKVKKKRKVASGYGRLIIDVLANGYSIDVGDGSGNCDETYVFPDLESMNKWIKDNLSPTYKNAKFMESL